MLAILVPGLLFLICGMTPLHLLGKGETGTPYRFISDEEYWAPITNYAVVENHIYVLFGGKNVLKCYSEDGTYLHSFYFTHGDKGDPHLRYSEGKLYLVDNLSNLYELMNGEIGLFYPNEDRAIWGQKIHVSYSFSNQKAFGEDIDDYSLKWASIWKNEDGGEKSCIIQRPVWAILANPLLLWCLSIFSILTLIIIKKIFHKG